MANEGFLSRWARLKARPELAEPVAPVAVTPVVPPAPALAPAPAPMVAEAAPIAAVELPPPTLADAAALTADADFSTFVAKNVDAAVRRLAMKKLFADPHFQGHDGLDIYMGDYNLPSPVSADMLAQMTHNKNIFASLDKAIEQVDALVGAGPDDGLDGRLSAEAVPADPAAPAAPAAPLAPSAAPADSPTPEPAAVPLAPDENTV